MKKLHLLILAFFYFLQGQGQFILIPTNTTNNLLSISILTNNIVVAGRDNYLVKSYNECNTLIPLTEPEPVNYQNYLCRTDTSVAYMLSTNQAANSYKIYKSTDGCNSWVKKLDSTNFFLKYLKFFNATDGFGVTSTIYQSLRTLNGGNTWIPSPSIPTSFPTALEVFGDSLVCLGGTDGGSGDFYISKDRGITWPVGGSFPSSFSYSRGFAALNKDTIFAISDQGSSGPFFAKSINGGVSWQYSVMPTSSPYKIYFKSATEGYVVSMAANGDGMILKTTDLGQNWLSYNTQIKSQLLDIKFMDDSIALVSGTNGVLFKWNSKQAVFTGIQSNSFENLELTLYPNPVKDKVKLEFSFPIPQLNFALQNALGQQLCKGALGPEREIDLRSYAAGVYFLNLYNGTGQKVFKIIKE